MPNGEIVLIPIVEAARMMSISRSRAYALASRGELPGAFRLGSTWRVNRRTLEAWADRIAMAGAIDVGPGPGQGPPAQEGETAGTFPSPADS
ncbi:MAG TPA: helix-turn-helix domain-containing protein [Candidatus Limnocylindrales bacterium]|jgi:excisionase family DNA binding protein